MMPKINGWDVCREVRETSKVPIIMLTAKVNVEYQMEYKGKGVVLYATDIQPAEKPEDDIVYFN